MPRKRIQEFHELIFTWFQTNQRDLPWRHTHDPYAILVSEVMLQQTQVDRVLNYYPAWLERWPTFEALAHAPSADVIRAWAGLGYNRRAVNLLRAARFILERGGFDRFQTSQELASIPGIGPGTAGALMNFVWNIDTPFLEVNLKRIFQRWAYGPETIIGWRSDRELREVAKAVLPAGLARIWPHALMDFGALACRPGDPLCEHCPLQKLVAKRNQKLKKNELDMREKTVVPTQPFKTTNRYWRGRIIDALRTHNQLTVSQLLKALPEYHLLKPSRYQQLLKDLNRDGLLTMTDRQIRLPLDSFAKIRNS